MDFVAPCCFRAVGRVFELMPGSTTARYAHGVGARIPDPGNRPYRPHNQRGTSPRWLSAARIRLSDFHHGAGTWWCCGAVIPISAPSGQKSRRLLFPAHRSAQLPCHRNPARDNRRKYFARKRRRLGIEEYVCLGAANGERFSVFRDDDRDRAINWGRSAILIVLVLGLAVVLMLLVPKTSGACAPFCPTNAP